MGWHRHYCTGSGPGSSSLRLTRRSKGHAGSTTATWPGSGCHRVAAAPLPLGPCAPEVWGRRGEPGQECPGWLGCSDGDMDGQARGLGRAGGLQMEGCGRRGLLLRFARDVLPGRPLRVSAAVGREPTRRCGLSGRALTARLAGMGEQPCLLLTTVVVVHPAKRGNSLSPRGFCDPVHSRYASLSTMQI